jgi:FtsP/CotA-like multicopper oxidase with cupredoxin domain
MGWSPKWLVAVLVCMAFICRAEAQCPPRPASGTVVQDPYDIVSKNAAVTAQFTMAESVDTAGYTHYCYKYNTGAGLAEAPTLRLNPGDQLNLRIANQIQASSGSAPKMDMSSSNSSVCGDSGAITVSTTNVHFHGMAVPPKCHQDDVINTAIQPGSEPFSYNMQIPTTQPPGLYWYHPHMHGFTEFQVNGGAAGALIVGGIEKYRPEVAGLTERVFVIRQQFLVPWVPGPYQLTINYQVAPSIGLPPIVQMKPGEKQFWRIANASLQDFLQLQVVVNGQPEQLEMIALDGYPLQQTRMQNAILIPPAGRAEFIVQAPPSGGTGSFITNAYSTGPTGNPDLAQTLANIELTNNASNVSRMPTSEPVDFNQLKYANLSAQPVTTQRKLYFSEEFGGTNGPIQFYVTVDGQPQKVFEANEKPAITTKVGAVEDWTIENRALETHAFHIHQIHFKLLEVDGKPAADQDMLDTITIPYWDGKSPYHSVKVRVDFRDPTIAGTFLFHCHILLHEDLGMMHKILVEPN